MNDAVSQFRDAMRGHGLEPPDSIEPGKLKRFPGVDKSSGNTAGWCRMFGDGLGGCFGDWSSGLYETWQIHREKPFSPTEKADFARHVKTAKQQAEAERKQQFADAAGKAKSIWNTADPAKDNHPYLKKKGIKANGAKLYKDSIVIPIRSDGELTSLQFIARDGTKRFMSGGRISDGHFIIGEVNDALCIAEGFATGATIHEVTDYPVAIAFNSGNLEPVAIALREKYPGVTMIICADDDAETEGNPGLTKAGKAAQAIGATLAVPEFGENRPDGMTDFNDQAALLGAESVTKLIKKASPNDAQTLGVTPVTVVTHFSEDREGAALLDKVAGYLKRFVAYPNIESLIAHVLWIAHTHLMESWDSTPRLAFLSAEPGSGKSRALEATEPLVPNPVEAINVTPAYLFRKVGCEDDRPTVLYDEIDTVFGPKARDNEEIRGMLNAGHRRHSKAGRCVVRGKEILTEEIPAYCAVAMAGLGNLPDTILNRSIAIRMKRRSPEEKVLPYRRREYQEESTHLFVCLSNWASEISSTVTNTWPEMPPEVQDRDADVWEALIAVADAAGGEWPERARNAAIYLVNELHNQPLSLGIKLLMDLRSIFEGKERMSRDTILEKLIALDDSPWANLKGNPIDSRKLSNFLRKYGITQASVREGPKSVKGYRKIDFEDAWSRYLSVSSEKSVTTGTNVTTGFEQADAVVI